MSDTAAPARTAGDAPSSSSANKTAASIKASPAILNQSLRVEAVASPGAQVNTVEPTHTGTAKVSERESATSHDLHKAGTETGTTAGSNASAALGSGPVLTGAVAGVATNAQAGVASPSPEASALAVAVVPPAPVSTSGSGQPLSGDKHDGVADTAAAGAAGADTHALPSINTARVLQTMQGSEMRVGMHSAEFGNISVSTSLNRQSIAAQISFEHMDLGKALTAHLPAIEARLSSEYGMHAKVEVRDQSVGANSSRGENRQGDGGGSNTTGTTSTSSVSRAFAEGVESMAGGSSLNAMTGENSRLDIQA